MPPEQEQARIWADNRAMGSITLAVEATGGVTRRVRVGEAGALRVRFPGPASADLMAVIVNTAGGIAGGDRFELEFAAGPGASLIVTNTAAEKVYRSLGPDARFDVKLKIAAGASLVWLPHETILFDRARLSRRIDVELAGNARLILAEALVLGRAGMGETVREGLMFDRWRVRHDNRLVHAEAIRLDGRIADKLQEAAITNGATAIATVLIVPAEQAAIEAIRAWVPQCRGEVGISAWNGRAVARFCAVDSATLRYDLTAMLSVLRGTPLPRIWLN